MGQNMITPSDVSAQTIHDLYIDARQFTLEISRPSPTTVALTVKRPAQLNVADGAVVLLSASPISVANYPADSTIYAAADAPDWTAPTQLIGNAQVVGAYYNALNRPFPTTETLVTDATTTGYPTTLETFTITVMNTSPTAVYYGTVHAVSNVLQYYPIGVSSYPMAGQEAERGSTTWSGNIPSYPVAPTSPTPGTVYHDQQLNIVQYYDGVSGSWIPTRADSIVSGSYNPGILGQVYLYAGQQLKVFDGRVWVDTSPANLQFRTGSTWTPLNSFSSQLTFPQTGAPGDVYYDYTLQRVQYYTGSSWLYPNATNALFNTGTALVPAFVTPLTVEPEPLRPPYLGQLFYNTSTRELNAWNGVSWNKVNTDQEGIASSDKVIIGSDGTYDDRIALIKILNYQLGWPQQCVEISEEMFNIAIQDALDNYRQYCSGAYTRGFVLFKLIPGQQKYYLNSAIDKTDHIVDIHKIHRMGPLGIYGGGPLDVWAQAFAQQYNNLAEGGADLLSVQLLDMYSKELQRMFAGDLMFQWHEASRELLITRAVRGSETVVIECMMERPEQELLNDRFSKQYLQGYALAQVKYTLGLIRSKFTSGTPGAAGPINLNGEMLIAEARQDMTELQESLLNYEYGGLVGLGNCSFCMG